MLETVLFVQKAMLFRFALQKGSVSGFLSRTEFVQGLFERPKSLARRISCVAVTALQKTSGFLICKNSGYPFASRHSAKKCKSCQNMCARTRARCVRSVNIVEKAL